MWMGGNVPLGYHVKERKLIAADIKPTDRAETVDLERFCALARIVAQ